MLLSEAGSCSSDSPSGLVWSHLLCGPEWRERSDQLQKAEHSGSYGLNVHPNVCARRLQGTQIRLSGIAIPVQEQNAESDFSPVYSLPASNTLKNGEWGKLERR